jgi:chemotaxis protein MotB
MSARKKHGGGGGGHGGGWVITFADLMALLMALFVMIVSFSNQDEQKLRDAVGSIRDAFGFQMVYMPAGMIERNGSPVRSYAARTQAVPSPDATVGLSVRLDETAGENMSRGDTAQLAEGSDAMADYRTAGASLRQALQDLPDFAELSHQIHLTKDVDGMHVSIVDEDGRAMFSTGSSEPVERMKLVLARIAPVIQEFPGRLRIVGHTSAGYARDMPGSDAWVLSAARANAAAAVLGRYGLLPDKLVEVSGRADRDPLFADDPFMAGNRRIELVLVPEAPPLQESVSSGLFGSHPAPPPAAPVQPAPPPAEDAGGAHGATDGH